MSLQGEQLHSHDYKDSRGYEDKKVVVIGLGNSGGDIAVELGRCSRKVSVDKCLSYIFDIFQF